MRLVHAAVPFFLFALAIAQVAAPPDGTDHLRRATLLTDSVGWVWIGNDVLRTDDAGRAWQTITPQSPGRLLLDVFFLDDHDGWALLGGVADGTRRIATLATTHDAGQSWSFDSFPVSELVSRGEGVPGGTASIFFLDQQHGWIVVHEPTSAAFNFGELYSTTDGGKTWRDVGEPPTGDPVRFVSRILGFQSSSTRGSLSITRDGGRSWQTLDLPLPPATRLEFGLLRFSTADSGVLPVLVTDSHDRASLIILRTNDRGQTWRSEAVPIPASRGPIAATVVDGTVIWAQAAAGQITLGNQSGSTSTVRDGWPFAIVASVDFADLTHGWLLIASGGCRKFKSDCWQRQKLLSTRDGGVTFTNITPLKLRGDVTAFHH